MKGIPFSKLASSSRKSFQLDPSVWFTLWLLLSVVVVGTASSLLGYFFGHESLKGVTQPDANPFFGGADTPQRQFPRQGTKLLKERDIIVQVHREISGLQKQDVASSGTAAKSKDAADKADKKDEANPSSSSAKSSAKGQSFPLTARQQNVELTIRSLAVDADDLVLDVTLKNAGSTPVEFLYDFLDVTDNRGQFLPAEVKGLPSELQPNSDSFSGVIRILGVSPDQVTWLSLSLMDYPDQKVKLEFSKIPVPKS